MSVKLNVKVKTESLKVYTLIVDYTFFFKVSITRMHCLKVRDLEEIVTPQVFEEIHDGEKKKKGSRGYVFLLLVCTILLMQQVEKKFIFLLDLFLENDPSKIITLKSGKPRE